MAINQIRDSRAKDWFYLDNELLEVFGGKSKDDPGIGIHAMGVYMVLAKHSNNETQTCKPSYQTIATILGVSRNTVITAIKTLDKAGLISIEQRTLSQNEKVHTTNIYTLKNIKATTPSSQAEPPSISDALPSARDGIGVVQEVNYPSAPEVPELDLSDYTNLNKTTPTPLPPKTRPTVRPIVVDEKFEMRKKLRTLLPPNQQQGISGATNSVLHKITDNYPLDWVLTAFDITALANRQLGYLIAILEHWQTHSFKCECRNPKAANPGPIPITRPNGNSPQRTQWDTPYGDTNTMNYPKDMGAYGVGFFATAAKQA